MRREISLAEAEVRHQRLANAEQLANLVIRGLAAGQAVEIDGLGTFHPDARSGFRFEPRRQPQVFLAYVTEDAIGGGAFVRCARSRGLQRVDGRAEIIARTELAAGD